MSKQESTRRNKILNVDYVMTGTKRIIINERRK